jgi:hypothetical protein
MLNSRDLHKRNDAYRRGAAAGAIIVALIVALAGCSAGSAPAASAPSPGWTNVAKVPKDAQAFTTLADVAPGAARLQKGAQVQGTECWTPSEHLFRDPTVAPPSVFRVICRVHYELASTARYTDVVCIGDFDKQPMLNECYIWKPHLGDSTFEDGASLSSPPPTPLP